MKYSFVKGNYTRGKLSALEISIVPREKEQVTLLKAYYKKKSTSQKTKNSSLILDFNFSYCQCLFDFDNLPLKDAYKLVSYPLRENITSEHFKRYTEAAILKLEEEYKEALETV